VGCGAAFFDYDNDGWLDIFLLSGRRLDDPAGATNRLYKNNRDGTFSDVTAKTGLTRNGLPSAVCVRGYDNTGSATSLRPYWGKQVLYRNNGDGTCSDVTKEVGLLQETPRWNSGCTFTDYNRDGHLDLFVASYLGFDLKAVPQAGSSATCNWKGIPVHCGPRG